MLVTCEILADTVVVKENDLNITVDKTVVACDTTATIGFDGIDKVSIQFQKPATDIYVKFYKKGNLVYEEYNMVSEQETLAYTVEDTEGGDLDIAVDTGNGEMLTGSVIITKITE